MSNYIRHITLNTAASRDVHRDEIYPGTLTICGELIAQFPADEPGGIVPLPRCPGLSISGQTGGRCLTVTVFADGPPRALLQSIGIAAHQRCGAAVWRTLHEVSSLAITDQDRQPQAPWCATLTAPAYEQIVRPNPLLHAMMQALAWAWLDHLEAR